MHFNLKIFMKGDYYEKFKWINIFKGFGIQVISSQSGGTIAGIYDDFISSISGLFSRRFWPSLKIFTTYFSRDANSYRTIKSII